MILKVEVGQDIIFVRGVPSFVCPSCGEVIYTDPVAKRLEQLVDSARSSPLEFVAVNYSEHGA